LTAPTDAAGIDSARSGCGNRGMAWLCGKVAA
jgi:hypothetical protein